MSDSAATKPWEAVVRHLTIGQLWRTTDGYLYRIVAVDNEWVYGRHPNADGGSTQINPAWFDEWELVRDV